jgi:hypothetical protein
MSAPTIHEFIRELDASRTHYVLSSAREGAVMMQVTLEFFDDREREVEIFRSNGDMFGREKLTELRDTAKR